MKKSRYTRILETDGKKIAFNSITCSLAEVDDDFFRILDNLDNIDFNNLSEKDAELVDQMKDGNFIVEDCLDELKLVKFRNYSGKFSEGTFGFVLAPTLACNFACPYCYETARPGMMTKEVQDKLIEKIKFAAEHGRNIDNTWYGGEPLLAKDIIKDFSERCKEICEKNNVTYKAYIVTNGYLIDEDIIKLMKNANITGAQITIDGPPEIHNQRRKLKNSSEPTFDKIIGNVKKLIANGITNVCLRINVDKTNIDQVEELLDIFDANGLNDVIVNLGHVTAYNDACSSVANNCLTVKEYAESDLKYQKILNDRGYTIAGNYPFYPGVKANYCCADHGDSFVVDPEGYMYKCWNDVGDVNRAVGNVTSENGNDKMHAMNLEYMMWSPFEHQKCIDCDILPICMGGCPYSGVVSGEPKCEKWVYSLDDTLIATYKQDLEKNNETASV